MAADLKPVSVSPVVRYRMVAIDMDGTLLSPDGVVTERTRLAVRAAVAGGWVICFATGRTHEECRAVIDAVGHHDAGVFVGGAVVVESSSDGGSQVLHRSIMTPQLAVEVCAFFEARGCVALAYQDRSRSDVDYLISGHLPLNAATELWTRYSRSTWRAVPELGRWPHPCTLRISIADEPAVTARLQTEFSDAFGDRAQSHSVGFHHHPFDVLEAFDPAVDKWQGVLRVARHRGIDPRAVIAVGDGMNDLPMIRAAGLGVAMGNAKPEVKRVAGRVIGGNDEDGVAVFLEELVADGGVVAG